MTAELWPITKIKELGRRDHPVLKAGPFGSALTKSTYVKEGYKVYGQQEVLSGDINAKDYFISEDTFRKLESCAVQPDDILITMMGTVGRILVIPQGAAVGIINPRLMRISVDSQKILPAYLASFLRTDSIQRLLENRAHGGTMQGLNAQAIETIELPLPSIPEQRRIAAVLDAWDDGIACAEKLVAAKERRFDWLRAEVLTGKTRLTGFAAPWKKAKLSEVLHEHGGSSTGAEEVHSVSVHRGLVNQIEHLGRSFAAASTDHYNRVLPGDIVYTKSPTGDFPLGIIKQSKLDHAAIVSPLYGVFTPASRELGNVLDALMGSPSAAGCLLAPVVQKGAKNTIAVTNQNFLQAQLALPIDPDEIKALSKLVDAAKAELDVHMCDLSHLRTQKRGLMQKLLTGQWRVPESIDALLPKAEEQAA